MKNIRMEHAPSPEERLPKTASFELLGGRFAQEDASEVRTFHHGKKLILGIALADGHGKNGGLASEAAMRTFRAAAQQDGPADEHAISKLFADIHETIATQHRDGTNSPGTTLTVGFIDGGRYVVGWAGNSTANIFNEEHGLQPITTPHEPDIHGGERDRIEALKKTGAKLSFGKPRDARKNYLYVGNAPIEITRSLGDIQLDPHLSHEPEFASGAFTPKDKYFLIASDGFWELLDSQANLAQVERILKTQHSAEDASMTLKSWCKMKSPGDNTTVLVVDLQNIVNAGV